MLLRVAAALLLLSGCSVERSGLGSGAAFDAGRRDAGPDAGTDGTTRDAGFDACAGCECRGDSDCAGVVEGPWSACEGFDGPCDESGMQSRVVTDWRCVASRCTAFDNTVTQACHRPVEGAACGSIAAGEWTECVYGDGCRDTGTRSRSVTQMVCRSGACVTESTSETDECSRSTDGVSCREGDCWGRCFGGTCAAGCGGLIDCDGRCPTSCGGDGSCEPSGTYTRCCKCPGCGS